MLWCAPKLQAMRTRIHKIQLQNPVMFEKKANSPPFANVVRRKDATALCDTVRPCRASISAAIALTLAPSAFSLEFTHFLTVTVHLTPINKG